MAKLRAIDQGTIYDVAGKLRCLVRQIERGEIHPRDVVVVTREPYANNVSCSVGVHHFGSGSTEDVHWMLCTASNRIEPA